jgi:ribonuclease E
MAKKMLIDATHAEETRVVVVDGNKVEEFDFESENKRQLAGNIYLAKVTRVEPSLQAAFVDYGGNRHGFLAFSEIHPDYYQIPIADREALMEEERLYAEALKARDEEEERKPTRSRRSRSRSKAEKVTSDDATESTEPQQISGMETIDLSESDDATDMRDAAPEVPEGSSPMEQVGETPVEEPVEETSDETPAEVTETAEASDAVTADEAEQATPEAAAEETTKETGEQAATEASEAPESPEEEEDQDAPRARRGDATAKDSTIESVADDDDIEDIRPPRKPRARRYKIQEVVKVRQILLVQVVKEERGNKGAALTTYLSLAGRYCVLMPNTARGGGISRKITNATDRKKLKDIASEIEVPTGAGLIVRTAGAKRTKAEIKRDYEYLLRLWEQIRELTLKSTAPAKIYEEGDLIKRSIRDLYNREIDEVFVEGERGYRIAKDFMKMIMPSHAKNVKLYTESMPLFARHQVESYLAGMFNPTVQLKSGGYIVIDVTEALVAIDVNSGRATKEGSIEDTATKTNLEAAEEVARQLRLRDLAGLIVIDFIDMDERKNNASVEKRMKDRLKTDRARIQVGRISGFGLMEMSRQRLRPGMIEATTQPCPACHGTGLIRSDDNMALAILRQIEEEGTRRRSREVLVRCPVSIANFLMNSKREHIAQIEARYGISVRIEGDAHLVSPDFTLEKFKTATRVVPVAAAHVVSVDTSLMDQIDADDAVEDTPEEAPAAPEAGEGDVKPKRKRRRRRRRGGKSNNTGENGAENNAEAGPDGGSDGAAAQSGETEQGAAAETADKAPEAEPAKSDADPEASPDAAAEKPKPTRARRSRSRKKPVEAQAEAQPEAGTETETVTETVAEPVEDPAVDSVADSVAEPESKAEPEAAAEEEKPKAKAKPKRAPRTRKKPAAKAAPAEEPKAEPVAEAVAETVAETVAEPVADAPAPAPTPEPAPEPEPEPVAAQAAPEPAPAPEPVADTPPKPKRRGWWSLGK